MFACGVEHGDHVLEVHAGAVKRRHRQGKVRVADLDGDRQVLEKLHEVGSAGARRQAEVAGLIEDAAIVSGISAVMAHIWQYLSEPAGRLSMSL